MGCLLLDPTFPASKRVLSDLEPDDFYVGSHRGVFRAAKVLHIQGTPPDSILVRGYLRDHKEQVHATIDNDDFVASLIANVGGPEMVESYSRVVRNKSLARDLIHTGHALAAGAQNGVPPTTTLEEGKRALSSLTDTHAPPAEPLRWVDISDLTQPIVEPEWLWKNVVARKRVTLLAGDAKAGKSWMVMGWLGATTAGRSWLDTDPLPEPIRPCYVSEEGRDDVYARAKRFGAVIHDLLPRGSITPGTAWPLLVESAAKRAVHVGSTLLILDTISHLAHIEDENDAHEVNKALDPVLYCAEKYNLAILPMHHFGRSGHIRGSTAFEANPDLLLRLTHHGEKGSKKRLLDFSGRFQATAPLLIEYSPGGGNTTDSYEALGSPADADHSEIDDLLLAILNREMAWLPTKDIIAESGRGKKSVLPRLTALFFARRIQRVGKDGERFPKQYAALGVTTSEKDREAPGTR